MVGAALLALAARLAAVDAPELAGLLGIVGVVLVLVGLVLRRGAVATCGLALLGAAYAASLIGRSVDAGASLMAAGLLLVAELAFWALEPGAAVRVGRRATARRGLFSAALALATMLLGALLMAVAGYGGAGGVEIGVAGVAAVAVLVGAVVWLMHSLRPPRRVG